MNTKQFKSFSKHLWKSWIRPCIPVVLVIVAFRSSVADWSDVPTGSMKPTILEGDRVFINKAAYSIRFPLTQWHIMQFDEPKHGDIVVFRSPRDGKRLIKRVVAVSGDTIEMRSGRLLMNGVPIVYQDSQSDEHSRFHPTSKIITTEQLPERAHPIMSQPRIPAIRDFDPVVIPPDHFFAMGDNRDNSMDSRYFGAVDRHLLFGAATHVAFSLDPERYRLPRWRRFFSPLP